MIRNEPAPKAETGPDADDAARAPDADPSETPAPRRRASLALALRLGLRDSYDYLGAVVLMSIGGSMLATLAVLGGQFVGVLLFGGLPGVLPLALSSLGALTGLVLAGGPLCAGLFRFARNAAARQEPDVFDLAWGVRSALARSLGLAAVQTAVATVLLADAYFFASQRHPVLVALGAIFAYACVFWALMACYAWPLLAEQEIGTRRILQKSALLVLDNFPFTLGLALALGILSLVMWLTLVAGVMLWAGVMAMFLTQATRELLRKYDVLPPDPTLDPIAEETHEFGGRGWHE